MRKVGLLALPVSVLLTTADGVGCAGPDKDAAIVQDVQPPSAYNDAPFAIAVLGTGLRPPLAIDTHSGSAGVADGAFDITLQPMEPADGRSSVKAFDVAWLDPGRIAARVGEGLLPGTYVVKVRDVVGQDIESHAVFTSLGPDNDPPHVSILAPAPGAFVGPGAVIDVVVHVDDGPAYIAQASWGATSASLGVPETGTCDVDPMTGECRFQVDAPSSSSMVEPLDIVVAVKDGVGRIVTADVEVQVAWSPDIAVISPMSGTTRGGTTITITGDGLVPGVSKILVDGTVIGGTVDSNTVSGVTGPHPSGTAQISVSNGYSASQPLMFYFVAPPILRLITPPDAASGPDTTIYVAGNDFSANTRFSVEQNGDIWPIPPLAGAAMPAPPYAIFDSMNRYTLHIGPGSGTITLHAEDAVGGASPPLVDAFTYDPPPSP